MRSHDIGIRKNYKTTKFFQTFGNISIPGCQGGFLLCRYIHPMGGEATTPVHPSPLCHKKLILKSSPPPPPPTFWSATPFDRIIYAPVSDLKLSNLYQSSSIKKHTLTVLGSFSRCFGVRMLRSEATLPSSAAPNHVPPSLPGVWSVPVKEV